LESCAGSKNQKTAGASQADPLHAISFTCLSD